MYHISLLRAAERRPAVSLYLLLLSFIVLCFIRTRYRRGLRRIPGPFFASFLPVDRLRTAASGLQFEDHLRYHEKYGPLVRVGPNHVSVADGDMIPKIYNINAKFYKSDFYKLFDVKSAVGTVFPTVFSVRDENLHKAIKRRVNSAYTTNAMRDFEPMVDKCIAIFEEKLGQREGKSFDLGEWLHWFAFDVITSISFSNRLGFMEREEDVGGIIAAIENRLRYNSTIGQAPWLHRFLLDNRWFSAVAVKFSFFARLNAAAYIVRFAATQLDRYKEKRQLSSDENNDMLAKFKRYRDGEEVMSDTELLSHAASNIFAGSDTTATTLRSVIYNLCKNPKCYATAVEEVDAMDRRGELSDPITYDQAQKMEYIQACIKEALRIHPVVGQLLERVVPAEGAEISGVFLPGGMVVGMSPWVAARDKSVYGDDCEVFRPERWIEADTQRYKLMERNNLGFGAGTRVCLGKHVSLFEISKLIPQLLRKYDIKQTDPEAELTICSYWFVLQKGLICRVTRRRTSYTDHFGA